MTDTDTDTADAPAALTADDVARIVGEQLAGLADAIKGKGEPAPPPASSGAPPPSSGSPTDPGILEGIVRRIMGEADRDAALGQLITDVADLKARPTEPERKRWWGSWVVGL
jgi:hypothetical protein